MTPRDKQGAFDYTLFAVLCGMCLIILAMIVSGCQSVKYVPVEKFFTDTIREEKVDTVYLSSRVVSESESKTVESVKESISESTVIVVNQQGDTLRTDSTKEIVKDHTLKEENKRLLAELDSLREVIKSMSEQTHIEDVDKPYPVEKPLTRWQQVKMDFGGVAMGGSVVAIAFVIIWLIKKFKK